MATRLLEPLRLAFIGMSGAGKTFWTKKLAQTGRPAIGCDDRIEDRLRTHLAGEGYSGIGGVAAWMGWPSSAAYAQREARYLAAEIVVLGGILGALGASRQPVLRSGSTGP